MSAERHRAMITKDDVIAALKKLYDPLLGVNIWDLGLLYDLDIDNDKVHVRFTRAHPSGDTIEIMRARVERDLLKISGVKEAHVEMVLEPQWMPDRMNDEAKAKLSGVGSRLLKKAEEKKAERFQEYKQAFPAGEPILFERDFTSYYDEDG